jgi:hypothetical protein
MMSDVKKSDFEKHCERWVRHKREIKLQYSGLSDAKKKPKQQFIKVCDRINILSRFLDALMRKSTHDAILIGQHLNSNDFQYLTPRVVSHMVCDWLAFDSSTIRELWKFMNTDTVHEHINVWIRLKKTGQTEGGEWYCPIVLACLKDNVVALELLLDEVPNLDINILTPQDSAPRNLKYSLEIFSVMTPLMICLELGHAECFQIILQKRLYEIDIDLKSGQGKTIQDLFSLRWDPDVIELTWDAAIYHLKTIYYPGIQSELLCLPHSAFSPPIATIIITYLAPSSFEIKEIP